MGLLARFKLGPKGWVSGAVIGGVLGGMGGAAMWLTTYMSGVTIEERWREEFLANEKKQAELDEQHRAKIEESLLNKSTNKSTRKWTSEQSNHPLPAEASYATSLLIKARSMFSSKD